MSTTIIIIIALVGLLLSNIFLFLHLNTISEIIKDINTPILPKLVYHAIYIDEENNEVYEHCFEPDKLCNDSYYLTIIPRVGEELYYHNNHGYVTKVTYSAHPSFDYQIHIYFELSAIFDKTLCTTGDYHKIDINDVSLYNKDVYEAKRKYKTDMELEKNG